MIPIRFYLIAAGVLALAGLLWHDHYLGTRLKSSRAETATERQRADNNAAQVLAEKAARAHEQEIARNASQQFQSTVTNLQGELSARPIGPVVIRLPNYPKLPAATGAAPAPAGSDAEAAGRLDGTVEVDIAPALSDAWLDCQVNTAQLEALQGWVLKR